MRPAVMAINDEYRQPGQRVLKEHRILMLYNDIMYLYYIPMAYIYQVRDSSGDSHSTDGSISKKDMIRRYE